MQRRLSCLAFALGLPAGGCNQVFGLEPTQAIDAQVFDAATATCPAIGTPPAFSEDLNQVPLQNCTDYTVAATGRVLARCSGEIREGMVDQDLAPAAGFEPPTSTLYLHPRLGPKGDVAIVTEIDKAAGARFYLATFRRGATSWLKTSEIPMANSYSTSSPSNNDRILVTQSDGLHELSSEAGNWAELRLHDFAELGITSVSDGVALTADGLRVIFIGLIAGNSSLTLLYSDRPTIDTPFSKAIVMPTVEYFPNAFLTEDCARLYVSTLGTVFYVTPTP